jgi:predicted RNA binding protein YcfA (HicA-like mRNA interferase family)
MKQVTGKEFARMLERNGWTLLRIKGSHHIYGKEGSKVRISVPIHSNKPLKGGLVRHFLSIAGMQESDM